MLCVTVMCLRDIRNTFSPVLYLDVSHLSTCSSCRLIISFIHYQSSCVQCSVMELAAIVFSIYLGKMDSTFGLLLVY